MFVVFSLHFGLTDNPVLPLTHAAPFSFDPSACPRFFFPRLGETPLTHILYRDVRCTTFFVLLTLGAKP
jgi:hypothetical protein